MMLRALLLASPRQTVNDMLHRAFATYPSINTPEPLPQCSPCQIDKFLTEAVLHTKRVL